MHINSYFMQIFWVRYVNPQLFDLNTPIVHPPVKVHMLWILDSVWYC
jgi:hypothetical protein